MTQYKLEAAAAAELDIEAAFEWYQAEEANLGFAFLEQLRAAYNRVLNNPFAYQLVHTDARRALTRRFPYAVYFAIENETILVLAVLHTARNPEEWQYRIR